MHPIMFECYVLYLSRLNAYVTLDSVTKQIYMHMYLFDFICAGFW